MNVSHTEIPGVLLIETVRHTDARGWLVESWHRERYEEAGIREQFVQDNSVLSVRGVLRGLHLQEPNGQGKLVSVLRGEIWDVAVDARGDSETAGRWVGRTLSHDNGHQLYIPPGCAHGYVVCSDDALVVYKCTTAYMPAHEVAIRWDDADLAIDWPLPSPTLSSRDTAAMTWRQFQQRRPPG